MTQPSNNTPAISSDDSRMEFFRSQVDRIHVISNMLIDISNTITLHCLLHQYDLGRMTNRQIYDQSVLISRRIRRIIADTASEHILIAPDATLFDGASATTSEGPSAEFSIPHRRTN